MKEKFSRHNLDIILKNYTQDKLIDFFKIRFEKNFQMDVAVYGNYNLERHTRMVLGQFDKYFSDKKLPGKINKNVFRILLAIHDLGKPLAVIKKDKKLQHRETLKLIVPMLKELNFKVKEINLFISLIQADPVGEYIKGAELKKTSLEIEKMKKKSGLSLRDFFSLLLIYYQCDASSYTEDAGGLKALDYLFVFDKKNRKLKFAIDTQKKINLLKKKLST